MRITFRRYLGYSTTDIHISIFVSAVLTPAPSPHPHSQAFAPHIHIHHIPCGAGLILNRSASARMSHVAPAATPAAATTQPPRSRLQDPHQTTNPRRPCPPGCGEAARGRKGTTRIRQMPAKFPTMITAHKRAAKMVS